MNGIATEIAIEIGVLLKDDDVHAGAREQKSGQHSGRTTACNNARSPELWQISHVHQTRTPQLDHEESASQSEIAR
jgi:hypothetical protein